MFNQQYCHVGIVKRNCLSVHHTHAHTHPHTHTHSWDTKQYYDDPKSFKTTTTKIKQAYLNFETKNLEVRSLKRKHDASETLPS